MEPFLDAVRRCLDSKNWYGALALALIVPDICARIMFPTERSSQKRYAAWFDRYLGGVYKASVAGTPTLFLSGNDCYALRCSFLHEGGDDIAAQRAREALQKFFFTTMNAHRILVNGTHLTLNVRMFCEEICKAASAWQVEFAADPRVQAELAEFLSIKKDAFSPGPGVETLAAKIEDENRE